MTFIMANELMGDVRAALRATADDPVIITDRDRPSYVLTSIEAYERLKQPPQDLVEFLSVDYDDTFVPVPLTVDLKIPEL